MLATTEIWRAEPDDYVLPRGRAVRVPGIAVHDTGHPFAESFGHLRERLNGLGDDEVGSQVIRLGIRKIVEEALEAELRDVVGRGYYEHGAEPGQGYRNGTRIGRLKTAEGMVEYGAPQVADREEPFHSKVREQLSGRTEELERLVVEMYARGLSTRDIEDALRDEASGKLLISRTAVSEVTERLWSEYEVFARTAARTPRRPPRRRWPSAPPRLPP